MDEVQIARETTKQLKAEAVDAIHNLMQYMNSVMGDRQTIRLMTQSIVNTAISQFEPDE